MHRVFIAINLPEKTREEIFSLKEEWPDLPCRWVKRENLHITLVFLGNINEKELEKTFNLVREVGENNDSFSINLEKVSYGPGKKLPPRLVWISGKSSPQLMKLKDDLDRMLLKELNIRPEKRDFNPHITLGRIRKWDWARINPEERSWVNLNVSFEIPVNSIEVMESHLKRTGAEYKILFSASLKSEKE